MHFRRVVHVVERRFHEKVVHIFEKDGDSRL